jgi:hypothetical protein
LLHKQTGIDIVIAVTNKEKDADFSGDPVVVPGIS